MKKALLLSVVIVLCMFSSAFAEQGVSDSYQTLGSISMGGGLVFIYSMTHEGDMLGYIIDGDNSVYKYGGYYYFNVTPSGHLYAYDGGNWDRID